MDIVDDISVEKVKPTAAEEAAPADPFADITAELSPGETMVLLAARGLAVFPCEPDSKAPAITRGFLNASTKVRLSADHAWVHYTTADGERGYSFLVDDCNLAFEPGKAGLFVVDIDPKNGGNEAWAELEARYGSIATRTVCTPSGGRHLYFHGTLPKVNKRLGPGIDTRCTGGYVLLPSSVIKRRQYRWVDPEVPIAPLPTWITEEFEAAAAREAELLAEVRDRIRGDGHEGDAFESWLALIGDHKGGLGFYNPMLSAAGTGVALGMTLDAILQRLRETVEEADRHTHSLAEVRDRLSKMPGAIRSFQAKDAQRERDADEEVAEEPYEVDPEFEEAFAAQQAEEGAPFSDEALAEDGADEPGGAPADEPDTASAAKDTTDKAASEWLSPEEAIAKLSERIQAWIGHDRSHKKTLTCLQSAAGLGKTRTMLREQRHAITAERQRDEKEARSPISVQQRRVTYLWERYLAEIPHGNSEKLNQIEDRLEQEQRRLTDMLMEEDLSELPPPPLGKFVCAVPRQDLADEIQKIDLEQREAESETGKIHILKGRNASNCRRYDLVVKAQEKGFDPVACCHRKLAPGEEVFCPHFEKCSNDPTQYLGNQAEVKDAKSIIATHKHFTYPWLPSLALKSRKRGWVDENPCAAFKIHHEHPDEYFHDLVVTERDFAELEHRTLEDAGFSAEKPALERLAELSNILLAGLIPPGQLQAEQDLKGWTPADLRKAGRTREFLEDLRRGELDPSLGDNVLSQQLDKIKTPPRKFVALFYRLADEVEACGGKGEIYSLGRNSRTGKIVIRGLEPSDKLPPNLLITDATLSPEILKAVFPGYALELVKIPVRRNAFITQTNEPVFSRNWLLNQEHLPEVMGWLKRLAPCYSHLVVLTTKRIRCAITGEDPEEALPVFFEIHGVRIGHYGNIRGSNKFEGCDGLVILGREQPSPEDMEEIAKCYWALAKKRLRLLKAINGHKHYQKVPRRYLMRDGSKERGEVMVHPDPRVQAVLTMVREDELIQAIDRARLIWGEPKDIYILCDLPLPGVEIDRLVSWDVLRGATRLNQALEASLARGENALPLAPKWLSEHFHELWSTPKAAERWVESSPEVLDIMRNPRFLNKRYILGGRGFLEIAIIEYLPNQRQPGHNRWSRALVWGSIATNLDDVAVRASLARALGLPETEFRWRPV